MKKNWFILFSILLNFNFYYCVLPQNLVVNPGGVYSGTGTLKMKGACLGVSGTITGIGTSSLSRIPGIVEWSKNSETQTVQDLYYTNLNISGNEKIIFNPFIYNNFIISSNTITRNYSGTVHYDYDNAAGGSQTITTDSYLNLDLINSGPKYVYEGNVTVNGQFTHNSGSLNINPGTALSLVSTLNSVSNAVINNSGSFICNLNPSKTFLISQTGSFNNGVGLSNGFLSIQGGSIISDGAISQENTGSNLNIFNNSGLFISQGLTITSGTFNIYDNGMCYATGAVSNSGEFIVQRTGTFNLNTSNFTNSGSGSVKVGGLLSLASTSNFSNSGNNSIVLGNYGGLPGVMNFDGNFGISGSSASLVLADGDSMKVGGEFTRNGDQAVLFSNNSNFAYTSQSSQQDILYNSVAFLNYGNLSFNGSGAKRIIAGGTKDIYVKGNISLSGADLQLNDHIATVDGMALYNSEEEIIGKVKRLQTSLNTTNTFTFNNKYTKIRFDGDLPDYITINSQPAASPNFSNPNISGFTTVSDVQRKITVDFSSSGVTDISYLQMGFKESEKPSTGTVSNVKFVEGDGSLRGEKLLMAALPRQNYTVGNFHYVVLDNTCSGSLTSNNIRLIAAGTGSTNFANLHDIVLSNASYPLYSVRDGRWSDPGTWDESRTPFSSEDVNIRHLVYTGIDIPVYGILSYSGDEPDGSAQGAANLITIANPVGAKGSALIIGNRDATINSVRTFRTALSGAGTGIVINNTSLSTESISNIESFNLTGANTINGLWILGTANNNYLPTLGTSQVINNGQFNNNGVIEIGE